jgi:hypothetical protein
MARVFTKRISKGQGPMTPDKSHIHHFLMRMGLKHNEVALVLGGMQMAFILLIFLLKDFSDHIALPIISVIILLLGYRLDQITVKYVKKKVKKEPKVLENRRLPKKKNDTKIIDREGFKDSHINMN